MDTKMHIRLRQRISTQMFPLSSRGLAQKLMPINSMAFCGMDKSRFTRGPYRDRIKGGEWSEWKQNQSLIEEVGATKRQSGWSVTQVLHITQMEQIKCSDVE